MDTIDTWKQKEKSVALFDLRAGDNPLLEFINHGEGNRINTAYQGMLMTKLRVVFNVMGWDWGLAILDYVEDYQTTCTQPHGAREMLLEAYQAVALAEAQKGRITLNQVTGGKP